MVEIVEMVKVIKLMEAIKRTIKIWTSSKRLGSAVNFKYGHVNGDVWGGGGIGGPHPNKFFTKKSMYFRSMNRF